MIFENDGLCLYSRCELLPDLDADDPYELHMCSEHLEQALETLRNQLIGYC